MIRPRRSISHFLRHWESTPALLSESKHLVIFFDFDGTLVRMARRPERVFLTAASRSVLERLAENSRVTPASISGHRRAELQGQIGIRNTKARFRLRGPSEVGAALTRLKKVMQ